MSGLAERALTAFVAVPLSILKSICSDPHAAQTSPPPALSRHAAAGSA